MDNSPRLHTFLYGYLIFYSIYAHVILVIIRTVHKYKLDRGYSSRTLHNARSLIFSRARSVGGLSIYVSVTKATVRGRRG